jgi:hypothetical protein
MKNVIKDCHKKANLQDVIWRLASFQMIAAHIESEDSHK